MAVVGIDLGTTYSAVATIDETGEPTMIKNCFGSTVTPSAVCIMPDGSILYGEEAKSEHEAGNINAAAFYKRNMGDETFAHEILGRTYSAADLSALFLKKLIGDAEDELEKKIEGAVITVPAYFTHKQIEATVSAAKQAGIKVLATVHEPTAAAFAYGLNKRGIDQTTLFYDLGGGTFDVTIAKISDMGIEVIGSDGDHELGGKDWDDVITRFLISELKDKYDLDLSSNPSAMAQLQGRAERIKKQLSAKSNVSTEVIIDRQNYFLEISREKFAEISEVLCDRTGDIINALLEELNLAWSDIDNIILVGGSSKMPMIRDYIAALTNTKIESGINADEAVVMGAAIKADLSSDDSMLTLGSSGLSVGYKVSDVVAHSLGMIAVNSAADGYINSRIIKRNSKIPASKTIAHRFKANRRNSELEIFVLQGEEDHPLENIIINKYVATGIVETSKDGEIIDVTYSYNSDGLIVVAASQGDTDLEIRIDSVPEDMSWVTEPPKVISRPDVLLAIDLSGSMSGEPLTRAKQAMKTFIYEISQSGMRIGVLLFADRTHLLSDPTDDYIQLMKKISSIQIGQNGVGGGNSTNPFVDAMFLSEGDFLVVLTDGYWCHQDIAHERSEILKGKGVDIIALGFGGADESFLKKIASVEELASMTDLSKLSDSFGKIAQVIQSGSGSISLI